MRKCIICEKELEEEHDVRDEDPEENFSLLHWQILYDGVIFKTVGNYGSTQFDPVCEPEYLEMAMCDKCLMEKGDLIRQLERVGPHTEKEDRNYKVVGTFKECRERELAEIAEMEKNPPDERKYKIDPESPLGKSISKLKKSLKERMQNESSDHVD